MGIKNRIWYKPSKKWITLPDGSTLEFDNLLGWRSVCIEKDGLHIRCFDEQSFEVSRYIGLSDVNGVRAFTGDIIEFDGYRLVDGRSCFPLLKGEVVWKDCQFRVTTTEGVFIGDMLLPEKFQIIGNKWEGLKRELDKADPNDLTFFMRHFKKLDSEIVVKAHISTAYSLGDMKLIYECFKGAEQAKLSDEYAIASFNLRKYIRDFDQVNGDKEAFIKKRKELIDKANALIPHPKPIDYNLGSVDMSQVFGLFQYPGWINLCNADIKEGDKFTDIEFGEEIIEVKKVGKTKVKVKSNRPIDSFLRDSINRNSSYEGEMDIKTLLNQDFYTRILEEKKKSEPTIQDVEPEYLTDSFKEARKIYREKQIQKEIAASLKNMRDKMQEEAPAEADKIIEKVHELVKASGKTCVEISTGECHYNEYVHLLLMDAGFIVEEKYASIVFSTSKNK